jgi:hypothetical protein
MLVSTGIARFESHSLRERFAALSAGIYKSLNIRWAILVFIKT